MAIQQKIIWMRFFLIGISFFCLNFTSCKKDIDYRIRARWIFINETNYNITFKPVGFWEEFNVTANSTTIFEESFDGPKEVSAVDYTPILKAEYLVFDALKCLLISEAGADQIENYSNLKIDDRYFEFTFRFTQDHFNKSQNCN